MSNPATPIHGANETLHPHGQRFAAGALAATCLLVALYYVAATAFAIWHYGWTELFADQFRQYSRLLTTDFPGNVLAPDNAHRQITSNLVRLADLHWGAADQDIGVAVGLAMLLVALALLLVRVWRDTAQPQLFRVAAMLLGAIALMWMGSARIQFHGNDAFQVYLVVACALLVSASVETLRRRPCVPAAVLALSAAALALVSFGSGVAVPGLLVAMLLVRRVATRWAMALGAGAVFGVLAYLFLLPGGEGITGSLSSAIPDIGRNAAAFVSGCWVRGWLVFAHDGLPGVDAARMQAASLGPLLVGSARLVFSASGEPALLDLAAVLGVGGFALLGWRLWRAWRTPEAVSDSEALGLSLAVFGAGIAMIVAVGRTNLFAALPMQVVADRYMPWSALFWLGLALALGARLARVRGGAIACAGLALLLGVMAYPSHRFGYGWVGAVEHEIERRAAQIQSDVYAEGIEGFADLTDLKAVRHAVDIFRAQRVAMFRAKRNHLMGSRLPPTLPLTPATSLAWIGGTEAVVEVDADAALSPAWHVQGHLLDRDLRAGIDGLVVVDSERRVVGMGEFGFRSGGGALARIDDIADGFDLYLRAAAPCTGLLVYGVDDNASAFTALGRLYECAATR
jgi:hypothetical protein